jgi:hypothetical protein
VTTSIFPRYFELHPHFVTDVRTAAIVEDGFYLEGWFDGGWLEVRGPKLRFRAATIRAAALIIARYGLRRATYEILQRGGVADQFRVVGRCVAWRGTDRGRVKVFGCAMPIRSHVFRP